MDEEDSYEPEFVTAVQGLERDLSPLPKLTHAIGPSKILVRVSDRATAWYLLGITIQSGFVTGLFDKI